MIIILLLAYLEQVWHSGQLLTVLNGYWLIMTTRLSLGSLWQHIYTAHVTKLNMSKPRITQMTFHWAD